MSQNADSQKFGNRVGPLRHFFLWDVLRDRQSRPIFVWAGLLIVAGSIVYRWLEGWSWLDSIYFCVVALTTVGFGDFTPNHPAAKIFTIFYILNGLGVLLAFVDRVTDVRREKWRLGQK
jgi:hypothetical protein